MAALIGAAIPVQQLAMLIIVQSRWRAIRSDAYQTYLTGTVLRFLFPSLNRFTLGQFGGDVWAYALDSKLNRGDEREIPWPSLIASYSPEVVSAACAEALSACPECPEVHDFVRIVRSAR